MDKVLCSFKISPTLQACFKGRRWGWTTRFQHYAAKGLLGELFANGFMPPSADLNMDEIAFVFRLWQLFQEGNPLVKSVDWRVGSRNGKWLLPIWFSFHPDGVFKVDLKLKTEHEATLNFLVDGGADET